MAIILALISSALFGAGDFLGGVASRRTHVLVVVGASHVVGLLLILSVTPFMADAITLRDLGLGGIAGIAGVVGEVSKLSTTASKRLQLTAEGSGVTAFILRRAAKADALIEGSAAQTRWRVTASPSENLGIPALARPRWSVALERVRGAEPKSWIVEACDAQGRLALPAILVDRPDEQEAWRIAV